MSARLGDVCESLAKLTRPDHEWLDQGVNDSHPARRSFDCVTEEGA